MPGVFCNGDARLAAPASARCCCVDASLEGRAEVLRVSQQSDLGCARAGALCQRRSRERAARAAVAGTKSGAQTSLNEAGNLNRVVDRKRRAAADRDRSEQLSRSCETAAAETSHVRANVGDAENARDAAVTGGLIGTPLNVTWLALTNPWYTFGRLRRLPADDCAAGSNVLARIHRGLRRHSACCRESAAARVLDPVTVLGAGFIDEQKCFRGVGGACRAQQAARDVRVPS